jgi:putative nucleotidyltransferase with HDIG domain
MPVTNTRPSFSSQVRRKLLVRLLLLAVVMSFVLGGVASLYQRQRTERAVVDLIAERVLRFEVLVQSGVLGTTVSNDEALVREFVRYRERAPEHRMGHVETARLYSADGRLLVTHPRADLATERRLDMAAAENEGADSWHAWSDTRSGPCVLLGGPVRSASGDVVARVDGAFRVSSRAMEDIRDSSLRAAFWVVLVIMATAGALYPIVMHLTRRLVVLSGNLLQANIDTAQVLGSAIAKRDGETAEHNFRVTLIAVRVAESFGLDDASIRNLIKGAFVHDVGKIAISDTILLKPGRLTYEEFEVMKTHVREGVEIVERSNWLNEAVSVVRDHHEKFDGSGYLQGLKGDDIPVPARIFAIADVFDALTSRRPYKEPLSFEKTMAVLEEGRGSHFDPDVLDAFVPIAPTLYRELIEKPLQRPGIALRDVVSHYFSRLTGDLRI